MPSLVHYTDTVKYKLIEGSLEVKFPKINNWKAEMGRVREEKRREEKKKEDQIRESLRRKKIQVREKVGKSRNTMFFQWFVAPEGRVRSHVVRWEVKSCTPLWREARFQVKMYKTCSAFRSWNVEKVHAVVARSTFRSQNVQNTTFSDHFWTFRCHFAWQAQGIVHLVKNEQIVRVL